MTERELETWETPLGERLTVAGKGGPWITTPEHKREAPVQAASAVPLKIPTPHNRRHTDRRMNQWTP